MKIFKHKTIATLMLIALSTCIGCSTVKKEGVDANFEIITSDFINPDHNKESRPLNISLFFKQEEVLKLSLLNIIWLRCAAVSRNLTE